MPLAQGVTDDSSCSAVATTLETSNRSDAKGLPRSTYESSSDALLLSELACGNTQDLPPPAAWRATWRGKGAPAGRKRPSGDYPPSSGGAGGRTRRRDVRTSVAFLLGYANPSKTRGDSRVSIAGVILLKIWWCATSPQTLSSTGLARSLRCVFATQDPGLASTPVPNIKAFAADFVACCVAACVLL